MRRRLVPSVLTTGLAASAVLAALISPAGAQDRPAPTSVTAAGHSTRAGTALVSGRNEPGTRMHVEPVRTSNVRTVEVDYQVQETGYWCGPAATRIALSARVAVPDQATLAAELGTTEWGTGHISQVTQVLNSRVDAGRYVTREMPDDPPTQAQKDLLWSDIVADVDHGYPIVANIVAPPGNQPPGYPSDQTVYHYFTVIGYDDVQGTVLIADPASFGGNQIYWLSFAQLASLIPPKGYAA
ncbi:C39 family peptidase [Streptomyces cavernicola]|uniref:C39 family peptidase n=1 Tax=Streptomyces cavernicola TaxID=3043613 RepID=A0ABT6S8A0_9ACTN|nr:C39 family peptidase [Streptomyces sp. B-S-A6]MDI3403643.1 C39 family peptidase [Streptomyces sp. B-S-A6]